MLEKETLPSPLFSREGAIKYLSSSLFKRGVRGELKLTLTSLTILFTLSINFGGNLLAETATVTNTPYKILPLPGNLNPVAVFNSNSPEVVKTEGILLSTFPSDNMTSPDAHLNRSFEGNFDIFTHHIAVEREKGDLTTLYEGIIIQNPGNKPANLKILASATYNSQPDSPFFKLPDFINNDNGLNFAGPGDRVAQDIIRNKSRFEKRNVKIQPNETFLLMNEAIEIKTLTPPVNGRTSLFKLWSDTPVYIADLALYEKKFFFSSSKPTISDWKNILKKGRLSEKRDKIPTPYDIPRKPGEPFIYGRVSGVAIGNTWNAKLVNNEGFFVLPAKGTNVAYVLNTVKGNTLTTGQVQSATMEKRYKDTAFQAHSNYGITYEVEIPLFNDSEEQKNISISFDSPVRIGENKKQEELSFYNNPPEKINFRGEFKLEYTEYNQHKVSFIHLVQRFGQKGQPLLSLDLQPSEGKKITLSYIYPADATPPHVLTLSTN